MLNQDNTHRNVRNRQSGMTLVEIILIIVLIGVVALPLSRLAKTNLTSMGQYAETTRATYDLQSVMERILADYSAFGYTTARTTWSSRTGTTNSGYNFTVSLGAETTLNGVPYTTVTVSVSGRGLPQTISLTSWISR